MIDNNEEWKEIEISEQNKKADIIDKYGFDIYEKFKKQNSKCESYEAISLSLKDPFT